MVTQEELEKMSPEEIAELQRKNCIFCKIIAGEIPSNKVFEDDNVASFLDINPATKGHVLVMPKEHAPILPLLPPHVFQSMFTSAKYIAQGIKEALLVPRITLFVANGAVAGQQASHFLFHIIPRETDDSLHNFSLSPNPDLLQEQEELLPALKNNLPAMMNNHLQRLGANQQSSQAPPPQEVPAPNQQPISEEDANKKRELILKILDENKDARDLLKKSPDDFKKLLSQNKELETIFAGVDLVTLSQKLQSIPDDSFSNGQKEQQLPSQEPLQQEVPAPIQQQAELVQEEKPSSTPTSAPTQYAAAPKTEQPLTTSTDLQSSSSAPKSEIFLGANPLAQRDKILAYFNEKQQAKKVFIEDVDRFKSLLAKRPDIQELFKDVNLEKLSARLKEIRDQEELGGEK